MNKAVHSGRTAKAPTRTNDPERTMAGILTIDATKGKGDHCELGPPIANEGPCSAVGRPDRKRAFMTMNKI